ncbi:unnamed protein product [Sphagnum jensenii]|uniref:Uncharacterized protein n=1 Tax=Sphagnum jensenii TaxID=128206 RepID=A0ABP0XCQ1_9BRYO
MFIEDPTDSWTRAAVDRAKALNNVRGVVFYAVPHAGSDNIAKYVNLLRSNDKYHARIMENVQPWQQDMEELSQEFENFLKEKKVNVYTFGEGKPINVRPCISQLHMKTLSPEDSWSLFRVHAFGTSSNVPHRLEALAKSMAEECGGHKVEFQVLFWYWIGEGLVPEYVGGDPGIDAYDLLMKLKRQSLIESIEKLNANFLDKWVKESIEATLYGKLGEELDEGRQEESDEELDEESDEDLHENLDEELNEVLDVELDVESDEESDEGRWFR